MSDPDEKIFYHIHEESKQHSEPNFTFMQHHWLAANYDEREDQQNSDFTWPEQSGAYEPPFWRYDGYNGIPAY